MSSRRLRGSGMGGGAVRERGERPDALTAACQPVGCSDRQRFRYEGSWEQNPSPAPCCRAVRPVSAPREAWHA